MKQFRMEVTGRGADRPSGVTIRVSTKKVYGNTRKQIADGLRLYLDEVDDALENWQPADTRAHLEKYPPEVLDSPAALRVFTNFRAPSSSV
jgi:hypothetical protein